LVVNQVEVRHGNQAVLHRIQLEVSDPGLLFLVGGGGSGKSSLLHAIAGNDRTLCVGGSISWHGVPLPAASVAIARLEQGTILDVQTSISNEVISAWLHEAGINLAHALAASHVETWPRPIRRYLAVMRVLHQPANLYLLDEPTAGLDDAMITVVRRRITALANRACVIVATHNRIDCLEAGGKTALLAGGTIQECSDSRQFFSHPATQPGRIYVETGNCSLPMRSRSVRLDDGVWWLVPGLLCGMSRPGMTAAAPAQYRHLSEKGIQVLICTEERCIYSATEPAEFGLQMHHFPIQDLAPPNFRQALDICRIAEGAIAHRRGVAVHCRGGLGRTGTVLASVLVWLGDDAAEAIEKVRYARPMAIQSGAQENFVHEFARRISEWH
jgi:atypical dual specificity phosphatase